MAEDAPKIHIDSDWKAEAQRDKERLAQKAETAPKAAAAGGPGGMPPANFETLISTLVTQALFALGAIADPRSGQRHLDVDLARHHIDMLGVIQEKTKGNLTEEEANMIASASYELRSRYIQVSTAARNR